ncbi:hypothetical protein DNTS_022021 [Danionella cerebrum]|uniref:Uncharacterized protein n=1 Tax=Danionella cerebrum TaxID=2873325 RepID=A0A553QQ49_9TELE|nr:hypothetical protein DNTS_022021 [Danionella translucida]
MERPSVFLRPRAEERNPEKPRADFEKKFKNEKNIPSKTWYSLEGEVSTGDSGRLVSSGIIGGHRLCSVTTETFTMEDTLGSVLGIELLLMVILSSREEEQDEDETSKEDSHGQRQNDCVRGKQQNNSSSETKEAGTAQPITAKSEQNHPFTDPDALTEPVRGEKKKERKDEIQASKRAGAASITRKGKKNFGVFSGKKHIKIIPSQIRKPTEDNVFRKLLKLTFHSLLQHGQSVAWNMELTFNQEQEADDSRGSDDDSWHDEGQTPGRRHIKRQLLAQLSGLLSQKESPQEQRGGRSTFSISSLAFIRACIASMYLSVDDEVAN